MIYHIQTYCTYGYWPEDLKPQSNKFIIAACDNCGNIRITKKQAYRDLCIKCAQQKRGKEQILSDETKEKMSQARLDYLKVNPITDETKKRMSDSAIKRCEENPITDEMKRINSEVQLARYAKMVNPGDLIVGHHIAYDFNKPDDLIVQITASFHGRIHHPKGTQVGKRGYSLID